MISMILTGRVFVNTSRKENWNGRQHTIWSGNQTQRKKMWNPGMTQLLLP